VNCEKPHLEKLGGNVDFLFINKLPVRVNSEEALKPVFLSFPLVKSGLDV